jgi:ABC-type dipeptide/oligopeptide/nickel transport system permease subunit
VGDVSGVTAYQTDCLAAIAELQGGDPDRFAATGDVAQRMYARAVGRGESAMFARRTPWNGLEPTVAELESAGLVLVDLNVASYHLPGGPTPEPDDFLLGLTDAGRDLLARIIDGS